MKEKRRDEGGGRVGEEEENFDPKTIGCSSPTQPVWVVGWGVQREGRREGRREA